MIKINGKTYNQSPFTKVAMAVVGIITLSILAFVGVVAFFIVGGFVLLASSVIAVRFWWLKRKIGKFNEHSPRNKNQRENEPDILEGEYSEVKNKES